MSPEATMRTVIGAGRREESDKPEKRSVVRRRRLAVAPHGAHL